MIIQTTNNQNFNHYNVLEKKSSQNYPYTQVKDSKTNSVEMSISNEGQAALRESLKETYGTTSESYSDWSKYETITNNDIEHEHYMKMREISVEAVKKIGDYNVEDVMKSIMNAYESCYNQIIKDHEAGDRQVTYELEGERTISLEEDLKGLDDAYDKCLDNLQGYIYCQQTNKAFEHPRGGINFLDKPTQNEEEKREDYDYFDKKYRDNAVSMMDNARKNFLTLFVSPGYKQGIGSSVVSQIINSNKDFMNITNKLFK